MTAEEKLQLGDAAVQFLQSHPTSQNSGLSPEAINSNKAEYGIFYKKAAEKYLEEN